MEIFQLDKLSTLQKHLAKHYQVYQMGDDSNGDASCQVDTNHIDSSQTDRPPTSSAKTLFFCEHENLFSFDGECFRETIPTPEPIAVFGVYSCDLTAIAYQDQFFADDPYYQARRKKALLIGIDCITPCKYGFCHRVDAGPGVSPTNADLILHFNQDKSWWLLVCNEKGQQALTGLDLPLAGDSAGQLREATINQCKQAFPDTRYISDAVQVLNHGDISYDFWQEVGLQCLACSGCTTLCPTCSCYGTRDLADADNDIKQQRFWDSCLYESFQREASQHNPSLEAGQRVRRFWMHKFGDSFVDSFDRYGCVGCGRCEETCPGVIGVHSIMKRLVDYG